MITVILLTMTNKIELNHVMAEHKQLNIYLELGRAAISGRGEIFYLKIYYITTLKLFSELQTETGIRWQTSLQLKLGTKAGF